MRYNDLLIGGIKFSETFTDDLSVSVGNPTKASEYNNLSNNTDAVKERYIAGHWFNNSGTSDEDGYHKGDYDDPIIFMAKDTGNTTYKFIPLWLDLSNVTAGPSLRLSFQAATGAPANPTGGSGILTGTLS